MDKPSYEELEQQIKVQAESIASFHIYQDKLQQQLIICNKELDKLKMILQAESNLKQQIANIIDEGLKRIKDGPNSSKQ